MNIFFLSANARACSKYYCDKHVVKIILEIAQLLYTCHHVIGTPLKTPLKPYRATHKNHPMAIWVRKSPNNYTFAANLGLCLCQEYTRRYGKVHKTEEHLLWLKSNVPVNGWERSEKYSGETYLATEKLPEGCTAVPLAMPPEYHCPNLVIAYRNYYLNSKASICKWRTKAPFWWQ